MPVILIVEDDTALRTGLTFDLKAEGYRVLTAENGKTALSMIENSVELVLLDVNLPDMDGYAVCKKIKAAYNIPVIFLTARDMEQEQIQGFECGADDYVTKPFSNQLLRKRIAAVLKRYGGGNSMYEDDYLKVDFDRFTASIEGKSITFTPTEYRLLKIFMSNAGNVLTRQLLLEKLWDNEGNYVDEHALTVNINRLRGKIESRGHSYIKTVYGIGYIWSGDRL